MYKISTYGFLSGYTSEALDMDDSGAVVGILHPVGGGFNKAFLWKTSISILPDLGHSAEARTISRNGLVAGAVGTMPGQLRAAIFGSITAPLLLNEPASTAYSFVHGINHQGQIVGGYVKPGSATQPPMEIPLYWSAANANPVAAPIQAQWAEALAINEDAGWACGVADGYAFLWDLSQQAFNLGAGEAVKIRGTANEVYGSANGLPAEWPGNAAPTIFSGLPGMPNGIANDANGDGEVVGEVFPPGVPSFKRPFLRRKFRRDELDYTGNPLLPMPLQLTQEETIDLNSLLPPQSGWTLTTAVAVNRHGQIAGTGLLGGEPRAYRLSPPDFDSPLRRLLSVREAMRIFGAVAAGGGGFGVTAGGHIIPIPPPTPYESVETTVRSMVRGSVQRLLSEATTEQARRELQTSLEIAIEEITNGLRRG